MDDMAEDSGSPGGDKYKRSRASKPKVKTGCLTCKIRRVKCDETKPSCIRCQKFGQTCDGYNKQLPSKSNASGGAARVLIPRSPTATDISLSTSSPWPIYQKPCTPHIIFQNGHEYSCFSRFCSQTSLQLSSLFDKELWTRLMLQACESSPSIRHAIIAIGALSMSSPVTPSSEVGTLRHQFAFRQYNQSICLMRREVAGGRQNLRTTLIACLLFYCFESSNGYHEMAIAQVYSGLKMIREWTASFYKPDNDGKTASRIGCENPHVVEDDILRAFGSLEIQVMSYADGRNADLHEHYRRYGQASIDEMPSAFYDLKEARAVLELVIRRSMHWLRSTMHLHNFSPMPSPASSPTSSEDDLNGPMSLFFDVDPTFKEQSSTLREYERWDKAFQPLLTHARSRAACQDTFLQASTLRLHWLSGYLSIASNNSRCSLVNNSVHAKHLEELVEIARKLLLQTDHDPESNFVFDMQIIVPLMTIGWVYRHRALRKGAVELLLKSPRKEGVWDGIVVGKAMEWLAAIEEDGLDLGDKEGEYVPEWAAAHCIKMDFDPEKRAAYVSCLQPVKGSLVGEKIRRETVIPW